MVSKVQPELLRQVSINKLLGADSTALQNAGASTHSYQVMCGFLITLSVGELFCDILWR